MSFWSSSSSRSSALPTTAPPPPASSRPASSFFTFGSSSSSTSSAPSAAPAHAAKEDGGLLGWFKGNPPPPPPPPPADEEGLLSSFRRTVGLAPPPPPPPQSKMDSLMSMVGLGPRREPTLMEEFNEATTLSYKHRFYGFGISLGVAILFFFLSVLFVYLLQFAAFGAFYTIGNLCLLGSSLFLIGPMRQFKMMFHPVRLIATLIYLGALGLTLFVAIYTKQPLLVLVCVIVQICAIVWYVASYLPFARALLQKCCGACADSVLSV